MPASSSLSELLSTLFERQLRARFEQDARTIEELCVVVLAEKGELSGAQAAAAVFQKYRELDADQKLEFFRFLNNGFDLDRARVTELAEAYAQDPSPENYAAFCDGAEAKRLPLFRRLNQAPGATAELVRMRADLIGFLKAEPELKRLDRDFVHLLRSWFNRGFLVLRQITWETPASILEKVIEYEAVHEIHTWDDLRRRLQPADRRCFAFFHPSMPDEPLIFVEIALIAGVPESVQALLPTPHRDQRRRGRHRGVLLDLELPEGPRGISFGNSLIKQVARDLPAICRASRPSSPSRRSRVSPAGSTRPEKPKRRSTAPRSSSSPPTTSPIRNAPTAARSTRWPGSTSRTARRSMRFTRAPTHRRTASRSRAA